MRIGIDIDDTITDTWNLYMPYYAKLFHIDMEELLVSTPYYGSLKNMISLDEYFKVVKPLYNELSSIVPLKKNVKEVIDELYNLGHKVIFISARGLGYDDPYKISKEYLDKNNIKYDKLIVAAEDKATRCLEEKIDLFIDDSIKHCESVSSKGIDVLMLETRFNKDYPKFKKYNDWKKILEDIKMR